MSLTATSVIAIATTAAAAATGASHAPQRRRGNGIRPRLRWDTAPGGGGSVSGGTRSTRPVMASMAARVLSSTAVTIPP